MYGFQFIWFFFCFQPGKLLQCIGVNSFDFLLFPSGVLALLQCIGVNSFDFLLFPSGVLALLQCIGVNSFDFLLFPAGVLALLQCMGKAFQALSQYSCPKAIEQLQELLPNQYNTGYVLCQMGKAYFDMGDHQMVSTPRSFMISTEVKKENNKISWNSETFLNRYLFGPRKNIGFDRLSD